MEHLSLADNKAISSAEVIRGFRKLKSLNVDAIDLTLLESSSQTLTDLHFDLGNDTLVLKDFPKLEYIETFFRDPSLLTDLFQLDQLTKLRLHGGDSVSIDGIGNLKNLTRLDLCVPVDSFEPLTDLTSLEELELDFYFYDEEESFGNLDYTPINRIPQLKTVYCSPELIDEVEKVVTEAEVVDLYRY